PEKTCLIEFGRFARERRHERGLGKPKSFDFLGFTHISGQSRRGRFQVERRTMAQRLRAKLTEVKGELRQRMHLPVPVQGAWLRLVVVGHYRYYGVPHNVKALQRFRKEVARLWQRSLSRRSHKGYVTWGALSQTTENRKVEARKPLIFQDPIFGFYLQNPTLRQNPCFCLERTCEVLVTLLLPACGKRGKKSPRCSSSHTILPRRSV